MKTHSNHSTSKLLRSVGLAGAGSLALLLANCAPAVGYAPHHPGPVVVTPRPLPRPIPGGPVIVTPRPLPRPGPVVVTPRPGPVVVTPRPGPVVVRPRPAVPTAIGGTVVVRP